MKKHPIIPDDPPTKPPEGVMKMRTMIRILKVVFIVAAIYLTYIAFYNSFGSSFSKETNAMLGNIYHLMNSLTMFSGFLILYLANFHKSLTLISGVVFVYNGLLSIFLITCIIWGKKASDWIQQEMLSGSSLIIIFVLTIIFFDYVGLAKRK